MEIYFVFEIIALIVCVSQLIFFSYMMYKKRCDWEMYYVVTIEFLVVLFNTIVGSDTTHFIYLNIDGISINWLKYAEWLLTLPIILRHIFAISEINPKSNLGIDDLIRMLLLNQIMIVLGITAVFYKSNSAVFYICQVISCVTFCMLYYACYNVFRKGLFSLEPQHYSFLRWIAIVYFSGWLIFPLLYYLGPEVINLFSNDTSNVLHAIGDIYAKNTFAQMTWYFHYGLLEKKEESSGEIKKEESGEPSLFFSNKNYVKEEEKNILVYDDDENVISILNMYAYKYKCNLILIEKIDDIVSLMNTSKNIIFISTKNDIKYFLNSFNLIYPNALIYTYGNKDDRYFYIEDIFNGETLNNIMHSFFEKDKVQSVEEKINIIQNYLSDIVIDLHKKD